MNRFTEMFKSAVTGPKMTHLPPFDHKKIFLTNPKQSLLTTFYCLSLGKILQKPDEV